MADCCQVCDHAAHIGTCGLVEELPYLGECVCRCTGARDVGAIAAAVLERASAYAPGARLIGNVSAEELVQLARYALGTTEEDDDG